MAHRVIVIGGGFAGLRTVQHLRDAPVEVTLIDRRNFHLFQPLTYQVATGALAPSEVAYPLRALFKSSPNVTVLMAEVTGFDLQARTVRVTDEDGNVSSLGYDTLVAAGGSNYSYFGHEEWREHADEVKSLESAIAVRTRILAAFEEAELETGAARAADLTFVVVGGGPTGVEMAGQIGELARDTMRGDFRRIDPSEARVLLVEGRDRLLGEFPPSLSAKAQSSLEGLGVTTLLERMVVDIDKGSVTIEDPQGKHEQIPTRTVVWAAGVRASGVAGQLAEAAGLDVDRSGRVIVAPDLTLQGHPEVFALGDMVAVRGRDGSVQTLPGVAPVAIQQGAYAARVIRARLAGAAIAPFKYRDKGNVATIGRGSAVVDLGWLRLSGPPAWVLWLVIHIFYLIGFQNRLVVALRWTISFFTHGRGSRLILATAPDPKTPVGSPVRSGDRELQGVVERG